METRLRYSTIFYPIQEREVKSNSSTFGHNSVPGSSPLIQWESQICHFGWDCIFLKKLHDELHRAKLFFRSWDSLNWKINSPKYFDQRIYYYMYRFRHCSWARRIRFTSPNDFVTKQKRPVIETPRIISQHVLCGEGLRCFSLNYKVEDHPLLSVRHCLFHVAWPPISLLPPNSKSCHSVVGNIDGKSFRSSEDLRELWKDILTTIILEFQNWIFWIRIVFAFHCAVELGASHSGSAKWIEYIVMIFILKSFIYINTRYSA